MEIAIILTTSLGTKYIKLQMLFLSSMALKAILYYVVRKCVSF